MTRLLRDALGLSLRHLADAPARSVVLVLGTTVALFLPVFTYFAAERLEGKLLKRADSSPILVGRRGSEFDLTLTSLYFRGREADAISAAVEEDLESRRYGLVIPLHVKHTAGGTPVVGTSPEYFEARGLKVAAGRLPALLGEIVAGARVAKDSGVGVGDTLQSDLANLYNIAGAYPVMLRVVGILERGFSPDDDVLFADLKTAWLLDGLLHGHQEVTRDRTQNPEESETENLEATASLFIFSEMTAENRGSFHLHADPARLPVTAALVYPKDQRAHDQLLGDFALTETVQAVEPREVIDTVLGIVLRIREGLRVYFGLVAFSTVAFFVLALSLTLRLRRAEITLMQRIGCSRTAIPAIVSTEIAVLLALAALLTAVLSWIGLAVIESQFG